MSELTKTTDKNKKWWGNIFLWMWTIGYISLVMHAIKRHLNCKWFQTGNCETWTHKHIATHFQLDSSKHSVTQITSIPLGLNLQGYTKIQNKWLKNDDMLTVLKWRISFIFVEKCYNHLLDGDQGNCLLLYVKWDSTWTNITLYIEIYTKSVNIRRHI